MSETGWLGDMLFKLNSCSARICATAARLAREPRTWLAAQLCGVIVAGACFGCWDVQYEKDTPSYVATGQMPLPDAMKSFRTLGYPLLLRVANMFAPDCRAVPWVHLALLCGTVLFFDESLRWYGAARWEAFFVASGILYAALPWRSQIAQVLSDFPSMLMAVSAIGCLFWLVGNRRALIPWLGLALTVSAAYQIRPAYLFLVVLIPCLGLALSWIREHSNIRSIQCWGFVAALAGACLAPLLLYCTLRFMVVGRFGLVNFGGYTLSGLASELLDPEIEYELPARHRPLAEAILDTRATLGMKSIFQGQVYVDLALFERQLSRDIFAVAVPAAKRLYGDDILMHEPELLAFSRAVISLRKAKYLRWVANYVPRVLAKVVFFGWSLWVLIPTAIVLTLTRRCGASRRPHQSNGVSHDRFLQSLVWLAPCYFLASVSLLCLAGSPADSRLAVPTGVFLPPLVLLWCVREVEELRGRTLDAKPVDDRA